MSNRRRPEPSPSTLLQPCPPPLPASRPPQGSEPPAATDHPGEPGASSPHVARLHLLERENAQLRQALVSRIAIEQAKGVLAERLGLDVDDAFDVLRRAARSGRIPIHDLAAAVVPGGATPGAIAAIVDGRAGPRAVAAPPPLRNAG